MKTITNISLTIAVLFLLFFNNGFSQDSAASFYKHELALGFGYANGFESHVFNVPSDVGVNSVLAININYCFFLNKQIGLGVRAFGYTKTLPDFSILNENGTIENVKFTLNSFNFDFEFRYVFSRSVIEPYGFLLIGMSNGDVSDGGNSLKYIGFNAGAGAGIKLKIGERWRLSGEILGAAGNGTWESAPFLNSTSDEYTPSMFGVLFNVSYLFGPVKSKIR